MVCASASGGIVESPESNGNDALSLSEWVKRWFDWVSIYWERIGIETVPGWLVDMIGVFLGAFLGALFGYWTNWLHERRKEGQARRALGSMFYGQMITESPGNDPIVDSPPLPQHASLIRLPALAQLLTPGVIDPIKDDNLLMALIHLDGVVENYNESARAFNTGCLQGIAAERLQEYSNAVQ